MKTLIFDMDDTLVVEENSAEVAFRKVCKFAKETAGIDPEDLYGNIRKSCRSIWQGSPAHLFCRNVGNSLKSDIVPAIETGMTAVWVNRACCRLEENIGLKLEISDLTELAGVLSPKK